MTHVAINDLKLTGRFSYRIGQRKSNWRRQYGYSLAAAVLIKNRASANPFLDSLPSSAELPK